MPEINNPDILAEVETAFARYERAMVANDIDVLDELFWASALTLRYGVNESLYGIEEIRAFRAGRPAGDLDRDLTRTVITSYGRDVATANTEYRRKVSGRLGRQSQTWIRMPEGWRIVSAHVSLFPAAG